MSEREDVVEEELVYLVPAVELDAVHEAFRSRDRDATYDAVLNLLAGRDRVYKEWIGHEESVVVVKGRKP